MAASVRATLIDLALLMVAFHQAFVDFGPDKLAPAPALFRVIQVSVVTALICAVLIRRSEEPRGRIEGSEIALPVAALTFVVASLIGMADVKETASLLMVRVAFFWIPSAVCALVIGRLTMDVLRDLYILM